MSAQHMPVKIFIVDSGLDCTKANLNRFIRKSTGFEINEQGYIEEKATRVVTNQHGTAVALIIRDICSDIEFTSINVLNERLATDARIFINALCWCLDYKPDIIHLSLGTRNFLYSFALKKIVAEAHRLGVLVVAALDNRPGRSYPAYLKGVLGVRGELLKSKNDYYHDGRFWVAPCDTYQIKDITCLEQYANAPVGNSMAAAYITGHVASLIYQYGSLDYKATIKLLIQKQLQTERLVPG